jgi:Protein of unknown function (DUF1203)
MTTQNVSTQTTSYQTVTYAAVQVTGIATSECEAIWTGGLDANGQAPQRAAATGGKNPCRHCLGLIPEGEPLLVLAYRPFAALQPYAETGPIFLHATPCKRYEGDSLPAWFQHLDPAVVRGYDERDWIRYDTGQIVRGKDIARTCEAILADTTVAYVHVRSKFNCFQCRVDRRS